MSTTHSENITAAAPSPFFALDAKNGDLIIRSADAAPVDFRVWKAILIVASPFFRDMLALPQPQDNDDDNAKSKDEVPIIPVTEDSSTLDAILRFCYPIRSPTLSVSRQGMEKVLAAALKYDMEIVVQEMCQLLVSASTGIDAVRAYAIACRFGLKKEACMAAKASLRVNILNTYVPEMEHITAGDYHRLLNYREKAARAVASIFEVNNSRCPNLPSVLALTLKCASCSPSQSSKQPLWWLDYSYNAGIAVRKVPETDTIYSLTFLSSSFEEAQKCERCRSAVYGKWHLIAEQLRIEVNRRTTAVKLGFHNHRI